jgi:hypothetical protein
MCLEALVLAAALQRWVVEGVACGYFDPAQPGHNLCHGTQIGPWGPFNSEKECKSFVRRQKKTVYFKTYSFAPGDCVPYPEDIEPPEPQKP